MAAPITQPMDDFLFAGMSISPPPVRLCSEKRTDTWRGGRSSLVETVRKASSNPETQKEVRRCALLM